MGEWNNDRSFESLQLEFGIRGDLGESWAYDVFVQVGEVESVVDISPYWILEEFNRHCSLTSRGNVVTPQTAACHLTSGRMILELRPLIS